MKNLFSVLLLALLLSGCGDKQQQAVDDPSIPAAIPCMACEKPISKKTEKCPQCGHPTLDSVVVYKEAQELERIWAENPEPFGGLAVLAKIKDAKESNRSKLSLQSNQISDLTPLKGLANLTDLALHQNQITDASPLKELTGLKRLILSSNQITDVTPLKGLLNLWALRLNGNQITDVTPLKGLTNLTELFLFNNEISDDQKEMIKKALPNCKIRF